MTESDWLPDLAERPGPKYFRIVEALAEDIFAGRLGPGARLPTHRDLSARLGVTVGTVSRAYAEAERRGLILGEVGRGSFVRAGARSAAALEMPDEGGPQLIELGINRPMAWLAQPAVAAAMAEMAAWDGLAELLNYDPHTGRWEHRLLGRRWLARRGLDVPAEQVLLTSGAEHGIASALMAFADPGDTVLVESLTWSGTRALASLLHLELRPVPMDGEGLLPDALEAACRASGARLLYTMPTIHNPCTASMSLERRRAVAEVARRQGLTVIEDDIWGFLGDDTPALSSLAPERSIYITSVSKSVAPTLRVGFAAVPIDRVARFSAASRATNWMAPPLLVELFARLDAEGEAERISAELRREAVERLRLARRALDGVGYHAGPASFHIWLDLPEPWRAQELVAAARQAGVALAPTELFVPGRAPTPHAVRVCLSAPADRDELERGLRLIAGLLRQPAQPCIAQA